MKIIALISVTLILFIGCVRNTQNETDKTNDVKNSNLDTLLSSSKKDYTNVTRKDTTITFLLNKKWESYHPDTLSTDIGEYTYLLQRKIWNSPYIVLDVSIKDLIAIDAKNSLMICYDFYSYKNFEVKLPTSELDKILQIDSSYVDAFILVKNFDFDFKLNQRISGWSTSGNDENVEVDVDYNFKYDLIIKCELVDIFLK